ncbi:MAG: hypothetical protein M9894_14175 [Planctomycetes bacterium]|nr:hypothetical protein [Planctomycetota bacterium]
MAAAASLLAAAGLTAVAFQAPIEPPLAPPLPPAVRTTEAPPPGPPSQARQALYEARALAAGERPDWRAVLALLARVDDPALLADVEALRADCERELADEERYQAAVDIVAVRGVDDYPRALELLLAIDRRSRLGPDAWAYVEWIGADLEVRTAQRAWDAGEAKVAFGHLAKALEAAALGPEARNSVRVLRTRWGRVYTAFERARGHLEAGDDAEARAELERVLALEENPDNALRRQALELLEGLDRR